MIFQMCYLTQFTFWDEALDTPTSVSPWALAWKAKFCWEHSRRSFLTYTTPHCTRKLSTWGNTPTISCFTVNVLALFYCNIDVFFYETVTASIKLYFTFVGKQHLMWKLRRKTGRAKVPVHVSSLAFSPPCFALKSSPKKKWRFPYIYVMWNP